MCGLLAEAGQVAWRIPAASAAGIVRSGPGAGQNVREWETDILCTSEPDGLAAGAGALPGARRRCEAGKRTHGPGPLACLALLAATALLALAAPAQAQTTTVTQSGDGATWSLVGENTVAAGQQTYTYTLTRTSGSLPQNEYFGFTSDTLEAERFQDGYSDCTGTNYFCFTLSNSHSYAEYTVSNVRFAGRLLTDTSPHVLTLKVATGTPTGTTVTLGVVNRNGVPRSGGLQITVGTAPTNTAPTVANTIPNQTATAGTAFSYAFLANTFADTDPGDTLTYTATQSDDTALPSWLSFAAATRTFSGTPTAADVGTVSVKVTASDGHGGSVSDTFDIVVSAAAGVTVSKSALTVTEEDTTGNTYTVVLETRPTANVTVTVAGHGGTDVTLTSFSFTSSTPSSSILTFTTANWNLAQTVTVKAGNDTDTTNDTVTLTHSAASTDSNYGGITIGSVVVTVADNDTANTAPTAANKTVTTGEDRAYAFTADDFGFDDADAGDTLASVTIVTVPAAGTLALDGTAVVADDVVTKAQIDGDMLTFTPALDAHGAPYTTFTFTVNDGTDDSASAYTMTIDVTDTPATVTDVVVTSTPMLMASGSSTADTYGFGETIVITVTVSEAVEVEGDPVFRFSLTNPGSAANNPQATYDRTRSIATTIVFTYTVQAGDMDNNGIWIGTHSQTFSLDVNDRIRTASQQIDIDRSHLEKGTQGGHKVDGSLGAPTVPPDPTAPTLVSATATTLTIEWTHPGDGGSPLTRNFIEYRVEGTTDWTNWYRGETPTPVTRTVITNLEAATAYDVRVHATNAIGNSSWTQSATAFSTLAGTASCPVPTFTGRRKIWTGVLTMGDFTDLFPVFSFRGYSSNPDSGDGGGLDPVTFTLGSRDYEVGRIALGTSGASGLNFIAGQGQGEWWESTVLALRLHVCNTNFDFSDSGYGYVDEDRIVIESNHLWTTDLDWSGVTTRTVHLSLLLNRPATGAPLITGQATVGQELAVDVTGIEDEDGLHDVEYTYQWVRVDADGTSNEEDITDETDATYTLTDDDLGKKVKIEVSFPDDFGSDEQRTSAPTDTVTAVAMTTPGVTVSTTALTVTEEDTTGDSYTVVLNTQPTATVTVTVAGHAGTDVTPSPTSLTFTTTTWGTAQTVTVTAGDDADTANDAVTLTHSAASTDTGYEGISIDGVAVTVNDNDTAQVMGVGVAPGNAQLVVTWTAVSTATGYTVQWMSDGEGYNTGDRQATVTSGSPTRYTIPSLTNGTEYTVRVIATRTGANDGPPSDEMTGTPTVPTAAGITVSTAALTVTEQDSTGDGYTVVLDTEPTADVVVTVAGHVGTDVTANPTTLTFTMSNWETAQTVTVTADDDADTTDDSVALTHSAASADSGYSGITIAGVAVTVNDNDTAQVLGVGVAPGNAQLVVTWTAVDTATGYTVQWKSGGQGYNTGDRQATVTSGTTTSHTITGLANGTEYTVQVSATRTGANDGPPSDEMTGTPTVPTAAGITVSTAALTVTEQDSTGDGYTVVLDTEPTADVVVTVAGHVGTDVTANPTTLTFTMSNWETAQTVTVTADDDADTTDDSVALTHSAASADSGYSGITIAGVAVTVNDNDTAQVLGVGVVPGNAQLVVTWTAVDTATGYTVQWMSGGQGYNTGDRQATVTSGTTTSHTITGLANGTEYTVQVSATRTGANDGPPSSEVMGTPFTTPPPPPVTDLAQVLGVGVAPGNAHLVVTWTAVDTATGYTVQWTSGGEDYTTGDRQATVTSGSTTRYTIPSLTNGTAYTVRVIATRTGATDGPPSAEMTGTPRVPPPPPPPPVTDLAQVLGVGVAPGNAHLVVTWTAVDTATGYTVQWTSGGEDYTTGDRQATVTSGSTTRYTIPSLTNGTAYTVRVIATRTGANDGPPSEEATGTPRVPPPPPPPPVTDLAQVLGVGVAPGNAHLVVTWTAVDTATGYTVQWMSGGEGYNTGDRQAPVTSGSTTRYTIPSLTNGTAYTVRVIATRTGVTDGPPSAEVTATPVTTPGAPQRLRSEPGDAQVTLRWDAPTSDGGSPILRYEYAIDDSGIWIDAGGDLEETVRDLTSGQSYAVAVRAVNAAGAGPATTVTASPVTTPGAPQRLRSEPGDAQVTLRWDAPTSDGGSPILRYEYAIDGSETWIDAGGDLEETVRDLTSGQSYAVAVRAVNAAGAGPATTVTSVPADPRPPAWLARFGRTATDHVVDAVSSRWHGGPQASHLTLGGPQAAALLGWTGLGGQAARDTAADRGDSVRTEMASPRLVAPSGGAGTGVGGTGPGMTVAVTNRTTAPVGLGGVDRDAGAPLRGRAAQRALLDAWGLPDPRALTDLRAALMGSSFVYAGAQDDDGQTRTPGWLGAWSAWGRGAASWFSGADGGASLEGEVATAMLGVDSRWRRWRAGVVASHSRGQGTYTPPTAPGGAVASTLTALHPYAGYDVNARTSVWGVVGYGVGEVSLTPARATTARETDLTNTMAAVGGRAALSVRSGRAGRFELALRSDARLTNTAADAVAGLVGATERTRLVRMMLEGAGTLPFALGGVLTPTVEAGLRYDTGDAETGAGLEVGGGLGYAVRRLAVTVNARGLLAHQDTAYEEWGFSGAMTYTPSADGRGLSMRLGSGWGATHSGVESLWSRQNAAGLVRHAPVDAAQAYQLEVRYGLDGRQGRARWAPYLGVESGGGSRQALRLGVTLTTGRRLDAGLELGQRQGASGADPEHAAQLRATLRW